MSDSNHSDHSPGSGAAPDYEFLIIGAGVCGLYMLHRLRELGESVRVLEAHEGVGGTWNRNRYPGCRFDSESYTYAYSFNEEILAEWNWSERFAAQPETLRYLNFVADKLELRKDIQFDTRVTAATYDQKNGHWKVSTDTGQVLTTRFLMTAMGLLSIPTKPRLEGVENFEGTAFHTYDWPHEGVDLAGKRVAVIGTGSTGVQVISAIAGTVGQLTVFQRDPNWCAPLWNGPISESEMEDIKTRYEEIFDRCRNSPNGFIHHPDRQLALETEEAERLAHWEELYNQPGFGIWLGNYKDTLMDEGANELLSDFVAGKIRQRVKDQAVADKLIPKDHGFGTKRVPLETRYYEVYNQPNVELVDINDAPIVRVTKTGITTSERDYEFDVIVYATGFDAVTGAFDRIDFTGVDGIKLRDKWRDGPETTLGVQTAGFPNLFTLVGPQAGSVAANFPRGIEDIVEWMADFVTFIRERGYETVAAKRDAELEWLDHVAKVNSKVLFSKSKSWFTGYNTNLDRDQKPRLMIYTGGSIRYRNRLNTEAESGYPSFDFSPEGGTRSAEAVGAGGRTAGIGR